MRLIAKTAELTPLDFIKKTVGSILYLYYAFMDRFHCRPKDCEDLVDGLLFIDASNFIEKRAYKEAAARANQEKANG